MSSSPPQGERPALPWRMRPWRRAMPWIRPWTRGACDVGWTQALPLDGYLPCQDRFHSAFALGKAHSARCLARKCHPRERPLALARIAGREDAQVADAFALWRRQLSFESGLARRPRRGSQRQCGEQRPAAGIGVDLELAGLAGFGPYDRVLRLIAEAPRHAPDRQGDASDAFQGRTRP